MGTDQYHVREYGSEPGDSEMVGEWFAGHRDGERFSDALIPPVGVIVELNGDPLGACWLHLSAGVGVGFIEWPITRPGLGLKAAKEVLGRALGGLEAIAKRHDYSVIVANTLPAIARTLKQSYGFAEIGDRVQLIKQIK